MALLLAVTMAGIQASAPATNLRFPARGLAIGIGLATETVLAGLLIALRWRRAAAQPGQRPAAAPRTAAAPDLGAALRRLLSIALTILLILIPLAILLGSVKPLRPHKRALRLPPSGVGRQKRFARGDGGRLSPLALTITRDVVLALLAVAILTAAAVIWRRSRRSRIRRPQIPEAEFADTPAELARAVESGRSAMRAIDDARAAIIACYVAMEDSLAEAGAARDAAETPDELLARAVTGGMVRAGPASLLTGLFYEARFSSHPMVPASRLRAERALAELAAALPGRESAGVSQGPGAGCQGSALGDGAVRARDEPGPPPVDDRASR